MNIKIQRKKNMGPCRAGYLEQPACSGICASSVLSCCSRYSASAFSALTASFKCSKKSLALLLLSILIWPQNPLAADVADDTMLMFVGEDLSVVTLASRRPESPEKAPAIARVVTQKEIALKGYLTLAELLSREPGFYISPQGQGSLPYLRGIADGILFLYDGVPMSSGVAKRLNYLDLELSLAGVKRVEIIRGPGSVLWGSDAFAGIVNIVPMTAKDTGKAEGRVFAGSDSLAGGSGSIGYLGKKWDFFMRAYGARDRWHDESYLAGIARDGSAKTAKVDDSRYAEVIFNAHMDDWLSFSGRASDFARRFTMHDAGPLSWEGKRSSPSYFLKMNATKPLGMSNLSFTGYFNSVSNDITKVDLEQEQKDESLYGEILWDRTFFDSGYLTAGLSFKNSWIDGAVIAEDFLPDYLKPPYEILVPSVSQKDYTESLTSFFAQYRDSWHDIEWWAGARVDDYSVYGDKISYNLGFNIPFAKDYRFKAGYGTAYRTPYSGQLFGDESFDPEGISTLNLQLGWKPDPGKTVTLTAFYNKITDYVQNDPYGGLSAPFGQQIFGLELMGRVDITDRLNFFASATVMDTRGDSAQYTLEYIYYGPDGEKRIEYEIWEEPYDAGPDFIINAGLTWEFYDQTYLTVDYGITDDIPYSFTKDTVTGRFDAPSLLGATLKADGFLTEGSTLTIGLRNILDEEYYVPGVYGPEKGRRFTFFIMWGYGF